MSHSSFILALDHGTTGIRASLVNRRGEIQSLAYRKLPSVHPQPDWVEQDPRQIWDLTLEVLGEAVSSRNVPWEQIEAIGLTNQRETFILWDSETGEPVYNAIVWRCRRTSEVCNRLKQEGLSDFVRQKTGLVIDPYFSATKIQWLLNNVPRAKELLSQGRLRFGTVDTWILWRLSDGKIHATDFTNASRTLLYNIHEKRWDPELLTLFEVPESILPAVQRSGGAFGETSPRWTGGRAIPITGVVGDQQAALFGQKCWRPGAAKITYGTGAFLMMNLGGKRAISQKGLLTTLACDEAGSPCYALEGSIFSAGATLEWLQNELGLFQHPSDLEPLVSGLKDSEGVYLVPAFTGLGAPYWDSDARAAIVGLTQATGKAHIVRAALEAMAYQSREVMDLMRADAELPESETKHPLRVDGGVTRSDFLMRFLADLLSVPVVRGAEAESTTLGAAYMAGLSVGFWASPSELAELPEALQRFEPKMPERQRQRLYKGWLAAVESVLTKPPA